jgi:hypothetical protein
MAVAAIKVSVCPISSPFFLKTACIEEATLATCIVNGSILLSYAKALNLSSCFLAS